MHFAVHPIEGRLAGTEDTNGLDISRDGRKIVYVGTGRDGSGTMLYLKTLDEAEPRAIPGTEGGRAPFFSPDGEWIAYYSDRELLKVSLLGGSPMPLSPTGDRRGGFWHPDGTIYFVPHSAGPVMKMSAGGGEATPASTLDEARRERTHRWPALVPGGKAMLYTSDTFDTTEYYDDARIEALDLATGEVKVVLERSSRAVALSTGRLLFARDGSLFTAPFDLDKLEVTGSPQIAVQGVLTVVVSGAVQFAVSDSGALAYVPGGKTTEIFDLVWLGQNGMLEPASSEQGIYFQSALSPSGDYAVLVTSGQDSQDLWMLDMERETVSRFTFEGSNTDPVWTPDGEHVVFSSNRDGAYFKPYIKSADGTGQARLVWDAPAEATPMDVSSDGRLLAVGMERVEPTEGQRPQIWIVDLTGDAEPYLFIDDRFASGYAEFSPDDQWVAYVSSEAGEEHVFVRPFPAADGKWQISQVRAREPRWTSDGAKLFYRSLGGYKFVSIDTAEGFRAGRPQIFAEGEIGPPFNMTYSLSPAGDRLLALQPHVEDSSDWRIHVILGWQRALERQLATSR
jgi:serine/threonine-protein kinase